MVKRALTPFRPRSQRFYRWSAIISTRVMLSYLARVLCLSLIKQRMAKNGKEKQGSSFVRKYFRTFICIYVRLYFYIYLFTYLFRYLYFYLYIYVYSFLFIYLFTYLVTFFFTYLFMYLITFISIYLDIYIFTFLCT